MQSPLSDCNRRCLLCKRLLSRYKYLPNTRYIFYHCYLPYRLPRNVTRFNNARVILARARIDVGLFHAWKIAAWKIQEENAIWKMSTKCQKHSIHCERKFKLTRGCNWRLQTITCGILVSLTHTRKVGETRHRVILAVNGSTSYYTTCNIQGAPSAFHSFSFFLIDYKFFPHANLILNKLLITFFN